MSDASRFLWMTCRGGAERALKGEVARLQPAWRPAYMRRGFLTFKCPGETSRDDIFATDIGFARRLAVSLGKVTGPEVETLAKAAWQSGAELPLGGVHVWPREGGLSVLRGGAASGDAEPQPSDEDVQETAPQPGSEGDPAELYLDEAREALARTAPAEVAERMRAEELTPHAPILDVCVVSPDEWWIGWHPATGTRGDWPGGLFDEPLPDHAVSRGYLKIREALAWSGFQPQPGQSIVELGCAPGGASQALLDLGLSVHGFDPADVAPPVVAHPRFTHHRIRSKDAPRKAFVGIHWLYVDINLPPNYTLDTVEGLLEMPAVNFEGMLLILKLPNWNLAAEIPAYLERIRSWNFANVKMRQLTMNRQEICVAVW